MEHHRRYSPSVVVLVPACPFKGLCIKPFKGASYLSSSLHTVSHSVSQPQCSRCKKISIKTRLSFIEILKLHSVTSRNKIRLNQTVINRFFFFCLSLIFHEAGRYTSVVALSGNVCCVGGSRETSSWWNLCRHGRGEGLIPSGDSPSWSGNRFSH